jgi:8-oxo-dGTP pyrophosphatase MutT (NUDIX family)
MQGKAEKDYSLIFLFRRSTDSTRSVDDLDYTEDEILLGMKKRGFGVDKYNGYGGKLEVTDKDMEACAIRELEEESGIRARSVNRVGYLHFNMYDKIMKVAVYTCYEHQYDGEAVETDEMKPQWFKANSLQLETMWPDDPYWLPLIIQGKRFIGRFDYDEDDETILDYNVTEQ